jgi:hypothetical protein
MGYVRVKVTMDTELPLQRRHVAEYAKFGPLKFEKQVGGVIRTRHARKILTRPA